ncbi:MAG: hypothetical protein MJ094_08645 [Saccharofermentans sp.]|nr:hypothetical protein [Saccharofermentans sp.]
MSFELIISLIFAFTSFCSVIFMARMQKENLSKLKKHLIATSVVYFSGTIFVLLINIFKGPIPVPFILISDLLITFVFAMSVITIVKISSQIIEIRKEIDEKRSKENS